MAVPETRYARNGDVHLAYQELGDGPIALVGLPPVVSNIEVIWEHPDAARFLRRFAGFTHFVHYDKRGQGLSDRDTAVIPTIDERIDDLRAVMDAAGIERAVLAGISEGGSTAALFAATYPERVSHLVLCATFARLLAAPDYPIGIDPAVFDQTIQLWGDHWGTPETISLHLAAPSKADEPGFIRWLNRYERQTTTPGGLVSAFRWIGEIDIRPVLASIQAPTIVVHRTGDRMVPIAFGRYLADHISGARFVELDGIDHLPWFGDGDSVVDAIEEFVTGGHVAEVDADRQLATVLFTDIVGSTELASRLGDRRWRALLDDHDAAAREIVESARGRIVKTTGDGMLATFDGPVRAIRCATAFRDEARTLGIDVRAGVHTGEIEVRGEDVGGIAVHIGARVGALAGAGEVLVSRTVADLVAGSGLELDDRGEHALKGVPGEWRVFAVAG